MPPLRGRCSEQRSPCLYLSRGILQAKKGYHLGIRLVNVLSCVYGGGLHSEGPAEKIVRVSKRDSGSTNRRPAGLPLVTLRVFYLASGPFGSSKDLHTLSPTVRLHI